MFVKIIANHIVERVERAGAKLQAGFEDRGLIRGLLPERTFVKESEEAIDFTSHRGLEQTTKKEE